MHLRNRSIGIRGLLIVAALSLLNAPVSGMNQYTYDLESLVDMSPQIVEGRLGGERRINNITVRQFKISKVHKGSLKAGQSIYVTALDFYAVSSNSFWGNDKLKEGDRLFLFFDRAKKTFLYDIPDTAEIYWPAPSGIRLIVGEKALNFFQYDNPGPYVAILSGAATNAAIPTIAKFREQIRESTQRMEKWKPLLERDATVQDVPALLQILRERNQTESRPQGFFGRDQVTERVCNRLVALHDISALTKALEINDNLSWALAGGFDSIAGRQFVWSIIADEKQPLETRIKWANFLQKSGVGEVEEHHLRRIAELAVRPGQDEKLQATLFENLRQLRNWWRFTHADQSPDAATQSGIDEAASILESFSEKTDSEEAKYQIDLIFGEFNGQREGIISILKFGNYDAFARRLNYHYDILVWAGTNLTTQVVFQNAKTGEKWNAPSHLDVELSSHTQAGGTKDVTLPKDLPSGRYRVFYEFSQDGTVVCPSHFFETDL